MGPSGASWLDGLRISPVGRGVRVLGSMIRSATASFLGSHINKIDQKGRVAAPADFRRALEPEKGFFSAPSLEGPFLECGGEDWVMRQKALIGTLPPSRK